MVLREHPIARVKFPDKNKMRKFADMVQRRESSVNNIIGFMDCVSFPAECTDVNTEQNAFYCEYDGDTTVNNIFA